MATQKDTSARQAASLEGLSSWSDYISSLNSYMENNNYNMDQVMNQIENIATQIQGLQNQIDLLKQQTPATDPYVNVVPGNIYAETMYQQNVTKKISVYGNSRIYVYASKDVNNIKFNGQAVAQNSSVPFTYIDADMIGTKVEMKITNATQAIDVSLYFSNSSTWSTTMTRKDVGVQIAMTPQVLKTTNTATMTQTI